MRPAQLLASRISRPELMRSESLINPSDRIFVAGHRGMAGSAILRALQQEGFGEEASGGALLTATRQQLDLIDTAAVDNWFAENQPSVVVLAAAKVGGIQANATYPTSFLLENLKIQNNVIEAAWRHGCRRLLFLGSTCIYPKFAEQPIREESLLTGALEPTNEWYAIAKIAGIQLCRALRAEHAFDALSLMPTNLYGPGDNYHPTNSHVMASLLQRFHRAAKEHLPEVSCWGSGEPRREFLHVNDLAAAAVHCLKHWDPSRPDAPRHADGQPLEWLNVGCGHDLSIRELAETIASQCNYTGTIKWDTSKADGTPRKLLDVSRIQSLGWSPRINLEEGIAKVLADLPQAIANGR